MNQKDRIMRISSCLRTRLLQSLTSLASRWFCLLLALGTTTWCAAQSPTAVGPLQVDSGVTNDLQSYFDSRPGWNPIITYTLTLDSTPTNGTAWIHRHQNLFPPYIQTILSYASNPGYSGEDHVVYTVVERKADEEWPGGPATITFTTNTYALQLMVLLPPTAQIAMSPLAFVPTRPNRKIVISPNGWRANVTLSGSLYEGDNAVPGMFVWYADGASVPLATGKKVVASLAVGAHTIALQATVQTSQLTATTNVAIEVMSPAAAVQELMNLVRGSGLPSQKQKPLLDLLAKAQREFQQAAIDYANGSKASAGHVRNAVSALVSFQKKARTDVQRANPPLAQTMILAAQAIVDATKRP